MKQIGESGLHVGGRSDFLAVGHDQSWARVNVAKTVHGQILGRIPARGDRNYIFFEDPEQGLMSVNWVDAPSPTLFKWTEPAGLVRILDFIESQRDLGKKVLVSCDQGISRAPTVGLLYASKRLGIIDSTSYGAAHQEFVGLYPMYRPSGIGRYVDQVWEQIT